MLKPAANYNRGIKAARLENKSDHRGGRGFPMRATDGDRVFKPRDFRQHFNTRNNGDALHTSRHHFRILRGDSGKKSPPREHLRYSEDNGQWQCERPFFRDGP